MILNISTGDESRDGILANGHSARRGTGAFEKFSDLKTWQSKSKTHSERFYGTQKLGNTQKLWDHAREHGSQPEIIFTLYSETKRVITAKSDNDK